MAKRSASGGVKSEAEATLPEMAYYYPDPYWLAHENGWIKSLLLFFDGVATLLPGYMQGRPFLADPELAEPLQDLGLLRVLEPETFVDVALSQKIADYMIDLIASDAFPADTKGELPYYALSMSRMGYGHHFRDQDSPYTQSMNMILDELRAKGLAKLSGDGVSIPLRADVRMSYLFLLAQEAREAGQRHGLDLHPTMNGEAAQTVFTEFLRGAVAAARDSVVRFDQTIASIDLVSVPLADVLGFRDQYKAEHRAYMKNLRQFMAEIATYEEPSERKRLLAERREELREEARSLRRLALQNFRKPSNAAGLGMGLSGAAWTVASGGSRLGAAMSALGAAKSLIPERRTGSAYSYIFRAHRRWK